MQLVEFLLRVVSAAALGGLIGSERERALRQRIAGLRTFAFLALLGAVVGSAQLFGLPFDALIVVSFVGVFVYIYYLYNSLGIKIGLSTFVAIPLTFFFGVIIGVGKVIEGLALGFVILAIFVVGRILHKFVERLSEHEITSIVELGLILFVLFPIVPEEVSIAEFTIEVRLFFNLLFFILFLNLFFYLTNSFFKLSLIHSGLVNGIISSTITIYLLATKSKKGRNFATSAIAAMLGSVLRNFFIIAILFSAVLKNILPIFFPLFLVLGAPILLKKDKWKEAKIMLEIPFSIKNGIKFATVLFAFIVLLRLLSDIEEIIPLISFGAGLISSTEAILSLFFVSGGMPVSVIVSSLVAIIIASISTSVFAALFGSKDFIKSTVPILLFAAATVIVVSFYFGIF